MPTDHIAVAAVSDLIGRTGVEDVDDIKGLSAYVQDSVLYVSGLAASMSQKYLSVHTVLGTLVYQGAISGDTADVALPGRGVYIVTDGNTVLNVSYLIIYSRISKYVKPNCQRRKNVNIRI